jgi:hypothetical protein
MTLSQEFQKSRLIQTIQILNEEVMSVDENKVDKSFFVTEEFYDLIRQLFENSLRTRHEEKIRLYSKILIGAILSDNVHERHSAEDFLIFLAELSLTDITVAKEIYKQQKNIPESSSIESDTNTELKLVVNSGWHSIKDKCALSDVDFN